MEGGRKEKSLRVFWYECKKFPVEVSVAAQHGTTGRRCRDEEVEELGPGS